MNDPCKANPDPTERETILTLLYDRSRPALRTIANLILRKKQAEQRALRTRMRGLRQTNGCIEELDPAATLRWNERLDAIYEQLTGEERMLGMYRRAGYQWSEIAVLMNSSPARLQKRFERAIRRTKGLLEP